MEAKAQDAESKINRAASKEDALKNAILAAELYMKAARSASSEPEKARLRVKCNKLVSKAEEIQKASQWPPTQNPILNLKTPVSKRAISKREEVILLEGSKLHGFIFPPWTSDPDTSVFEESINGSSLYIEPTDLHLSDAQLDIFAGWQRPSENLTKISGKEDGPIGDDYPMIASNPIDLVQDITTDCSVVASLCATTARALKGHSKLLDSLLYPYDKSKARPRVSKNGKYIFRFHFNGTFRKVTIDDRLPASNTSRSLHVIDRNNSQLLWPALLEKAYLKVRGGYDFPGSNSGTDLWVITGWIPEQVFLQSDDLQSENLWKRVFKAFGYGDVMITLGTGTLSRKEERELGLVGEHDYAILDLKEVGTQRLLLVKNPWCDGMVWKGSQESKDTWTEWLQEALPENPKTTPGAFWMSFEAVAQHFESLYLNWNPELFLHRQDHHFSWTIPKIKSPGSFTHNPQYLLRPTSKGTVWILLSRHFATGEQDIARNKNNDTSISAASNALGFISLYVFEASGRRVYLSDNALHRGAYVDSPQTLVRLEVDSSTAYTIVIAQHGLPLPKYSFTLSFFSRSPLNISTAIDSLTHCTTHNGAWSVRTAGGNASSPSYPLNPQFNIQIPSQSDLLLVLETDQEELAVHVKMVWANGQRVTAVTSKDIVGDSGDYRRGCALASIRNVAAGKYTIVCSTFEAGQTGHFTLRVGAMVECEVRPVMAETAGRLSLRLPPLVFRDEIDRMLAPIEVARLTRMRVVVRCGRLTQGSRSRVPLKISLERGQGPNKIVLDVSMDGEFSDAPMGVRSSDLDLSPEMVRAGGVWLVVERLGGRSGMDEVDVEVLADGQVNVGSWGVGNG